MGRGNAICAILAAFFLISLPLRTSATVVATASMSKPRTVLTATKLTSGRVLVVGGTNNTAGMYGNGASNFPTSTEVFDPITETWSYSGYLTTGRYAHTATLLPGGAVLVTGGVGIGNGNNTITLSSAELYDPVSGLWSAVASMAQPRAYHTATLLQNGKVLVVGGDSLGTAELYDPSTGSWASAGNLLQTTVEHSATLLPDGSVLIAGGSFSSFVTSAQRFDPVSQTWSAAGNMSTARRRSTATLDTFGRVLVVGGTFSSVVLSSAELYNSTAATWMSAPTLADARAQHVADLLPRGQVVVFGGVGPQVVLSSVELFDNADGGWRGVEPLLVPRANHAEVLLDDGRILIVGGANSTGILATAELYNPNPSPPVIGNVQAGNQSASVSFTPTSIGAGVLLSYTANCGGIVGTGSGSPVLVSGLANGVAYTCKVKTSSTVGDSNWSADTGPVVPFSLPDAPAIGAARAANTAIDVSFKPNSLGSGALVHYMATCDSPSAASIFQSGMTSPLTVNGAAVGATYVCRVQAITTVGTSPWSEASNAVTPANPPTSPTGLTIAPGPGAAIIGFGVPANSGGSPIMGYVASCAAPNQPTKSAAGSASPIRVQGLRGGVLYSCSVVAISASGGTGLPSDAVQVVPSARRGPMPILMLLL